MERVDQTFRPQRAFPINAVKERSANADHIDVVLIVGPKTTFERDALVEVTKAQGLNFLVVGDGVTPITRAEIELMLSKASFSPKTHFIATGHGNVVKKEGVEGHRALGWLTSDLVSLIAPEEAAPSGLIPSCVLHLSACAIDALMKELPPDHPLWKRVACMLHGEGAQTSVHNSLTNLTVVLECLGRAKKLGEPTPTVLQIFGKVTEISGDVVNLLGMDDAAPLRNDPLEVLESLLREELDFRTDAHLPLSETERKISRRKLENIFFNLVSRGDVERARSTLLAAPELIDTRDSLQYTPLHTACYHGHTDLVDMLLGLGADVDLRDISGQTPLYGACRTQQSEITRKLIESGANPNVADRVGTTPLHIACETGNFENVARLLDAGADVNAATADGFTPLIKACSNRRADAARLLLEHPLIEPDLADLNDSTPLHHACLANCTEVAVLLAPHAKASFHRHNVSKFRPLEIALETQNFDIVTALVINGSADGFRYSMNTNLLHMAGLHGRNDLCDILLAFSTLDIEAKTELGETALLCACAKGSSSVAAMLLKAGADIEAWDLRGMTPLAAACVTGDAATVRLLLHHKANAAARDRIDRTPLHLASRRSEESSKIAVCLLNAASTKIDAVDSFGRTALMYAALRGDLEMTHLLLDCGADKLTTDASRRTALELVADALGEFSLDWNLRVALKSVQQRLNQTDE